MVKSRDIKIGILGGSFDPAHLGHLKISKVAIKKIGLKKLYWVITKKNPFKKRTYFSLQDRLKSVRKIIKGQKKIQVLYLDDTVKSSRSFDIISYIIRRKKLNNLYFIIGSDILPNFHKWKNWKKLVKLVKLIVFSRKGYDRKSKKTIVVKYLNKNNISFIKNKPIRVSSSLLRKRIKI